MSAFALTREERAFARVSKDGRAWNCLMPFLSRLPLWRQQARPRLLQYRPVLQSGPLQSGRMIRLLHAWRLLNARRVLRSRLSLRTGL
jgi:hypothetical protein